MIDPSILMILVDVVVDVSDIQLVGRGRVGNEARDSIVHWVRNGALPTEVVLQRQFAMWASVCNHSQFPKCDEGFVLKKIIESGAVVQVGASSLFR